VRNVNFRAKLLLRVAFLGVLVLSIQASSCEPPSTKPGKTGPNPTHELTVFSKAADIWRSDIKEGMKEVDLSGLTDQQKQLALRLLNEVPCDCGCRTTTVAECRKDIPDCGEGNRQAEFITDQVKASKSEGQIVKELYAKVLSHRFRRSVLPLLDSISPDKEKDYMVAQLARMTVGVDTSSLKITDNEMADARAVAALFLGERKGILPYLEGASDELYLIHGIVWELLQPPQRPLFEYYLYRHRPELQKKIMPFLNPTVSLAEMIMGVAINFFGPPEPPGGYKVIPGDGPSRGPKNAPVVIVEYSDFECPYSGRVQPTLDKLIEAYPDKVRHVHRNFPLNFHKNAKAAAQAALAAGKQGKFWEMNRKIYANQRGLSMTKLEEFAKELGLDMDRFKVDINSYETVKRVQDDMNVAMRIGVSSTPTVFVNDKMIKGAQGYCAFMELIEAELRK